MMDPLTQDYCGREHYSGSNITGEEEMLDTKGEDFTVPNIQIKEEEDAEDFRSSHEHQILPLEIVVKGEPADEHTETEPVDEHRETLQELEFVCVKEERCPEPGSGDERMEADIFSEEALLENSLDDKTNEEDEEGEDTTPSVHQNGDSRGESDRAVQQQDDYWITADTLKRDTVRRGPGRPRGRGRGRGARSLSDRPYRCAICQKGFRKPEHLRCHEMFHSEDRPFSCEICNKGFVTNSDLRRHKVVHTGEKPYSCSLCSKTFTQLCNMQAHLRNRCQPKRYGCHLCNRMFRDKAVLEKHMANHGDGRKHKKRIRPICKDLPPFICDVCSMSFEQKRKLMVHVRVHLEIDMVICKVCGKNCARRERLVVHMRSHTGEKPFTCKLCGKSFTQQCNLKKHEVLHLPD